MSVNVSPSVFDDCVHVVVSPLHVQPVPEPRLLRRRRRMRRRLRQGGGRWSSFSRKLSSWGVGASGRASVARFLSLATTICRSPPLGRKVGCAPSERGQGDSFGGVERALCGVERALCGVDRPLCAAKRGSCGVERASCAAERRWFDADLPAGQRRTSLVRRRTSLVRRRTNLVRRRTNLVRRCLRRRSTSNQSCRTEPAVAERRPRA